MLYKISNNAPLHEIEEHLHSKFDYDNLYKATDHIDGRKEASVCIVTADAPHRIQYGIWGILPHGYKDSWKSFQSLYNTLEIAPASVSHTSWLYEPLKHRRCLIVATGFYTGEVENNIMQSYYTSIKDEHIFCFGGIYNILEDGFISYSILSHTSTHATSYLKHARPIIIDKQHYTDFLNNYRPLESLCASDDVLFTSKYNSIDI
ncbi:SOS response associated peptidase (SRAP) [Gelidibacter sediminis]|uniref:Abasic site processing protein n=1 Tax=Gelidibacter sediminis TaxID=1608710 RepID=A0A4V3F6Y8_9FLAO|nr:SOS response-associated peptidase family protein [Gelidibacter sediminis]TDU34466.1 SOS response associated peptidase (SRAP) [Gelidibacter sediminis]